jgi:hypothetical protein
MQARAELQGWRLKAAKKVWRMAARSAAFFSWLEMKIGLHKQVANRITEPYQFINVVLTATEWKNFFELRCHADAMPEFRALAMDIDWIISAHRDSLRVLQPGEWHLPYVTDEERGEYDINTLVEISTARCARVSYKPFDSDTMDAAKDLELHDKLVNANPPHMSPAEHQAVAIGQDMFFKKFRGFQQYRTYVELKKYGQPYSG